MQKEILIEKLDHFGRGIANNEKIMFIENALPNELIEIEITKETKKYIEAETKKIIRKSKNRVEPMCPYYNLCGGCNIMHLDYNEQLKFKEQKVKEILKRFANIEEEKVKPIIKSNTKYYRNKITLKVKEKLGLYQKKSYDLVNIDKCLIVSKKINELIKLLNELNLNNIEEIVIKDAYNEKTIINIKGKNIDKKYLKENLKSHTENLVIYDNNKKEILLGDGFIIDKINDYYFKISDDSFFQVNRYTTEKLYNKVKEYANLKKEERLLDLYCGTGTIGMYLSRDAKEVIGIEINEHAVENANENKKINSIENISFICSDVGKIKEKYKNIDVVVIDPPRNGLSMEALQNVLDINPKRIVYVSCDPVTLARDLNILKDYYEIKEITPTDMFPNTYHVENVCLLSK